MPIDQQIGGDLIAYVLRHMACETCHKAYAPGSVQVVLHKDGQWGLSATCPVCHAVRTIQAFDRPPYTCLRPDEAVIPARITEDTVTEWVSFLAAFTGDMYDLLAPSE